MIYVTVLIDPPDLILAIALLSYFEIVASVVKSYPASLLLDEYKHLY